VTAKPVTVTAAGIDRTYDATTSATATLSSAGVITGDVISLSGTASFPDKRVGSGKSVTVTGIAASGADAANYTLLNTTVSTAASIAARPITVTAAAADRVYDATTTATVALTSSGVLSAADSRFADRHAGSKTVTTTGITAGGIDAANYVLNNASATSTARIAPRPVPVVATAADKPYDATTTATVSLASSGILAGDTVGFSATAANFADANAATGKTVLVTGLHTTGPVAGNYVPSTASVTTTASVTPVPLTVTALSQVKPYDGIPYAGGAGIRFTGYVGGENVSVLGGAIQYSGSAQGAVQTGNYELRPGGYTSGNYLIGYESGTLTIELQSQAAVAVGTPARQDAYEAARYNASTVNTPIMPSTPSAYATPALVMPSRLMPVTLPALPFVQRPTPAAATTGGRAVPPQAPTAVPPRRDPIDD